MIDLRLAVTDQTVGDQPVFIKCREHNDKNRGNLAVYDDHLYCYVCGFTLGTKDKGLPGHRDPLAYLLKVEDASSVADKYTVESIDRYRERAAQEARRDPLPRSLATIYNRILNTARHHRLQWFFARGLTLECINDPDVLLGHDGTRFVIPVFDKDRNLVTLRYRLDPDYCSEAEIAKHKYLGLKGRNGLYLYPEPLLEHAEQTGTLILCEGELDALRLWQEGMHAVSVTNGAGQVQKLPPLIKEQYPHIHALVIATDQDEAGEAAAEGHTNDKGMFVPGTRQVAEALGFKVTRLRWKEGKDVTEHLQLRAA